jgi:hypothetical protein
MSSKNQDKIRKIYITVKTQSKLIMKQNLIGFLELKYPLIKEYKISVGALIN